MYKAHFENQYVGKLCATFCSILLRNFISFGEILNYVEFIELFANRGI